MRLQTRGKYPLPKVVATKTPHLDSLVRTELSSATKSDDKELAKIQTFMLDALAPLTSILEADSEKASYDEVIDATKAAVALIGKANAKISHLRRQKVISQHSCPLWTMIQTFKTRHPLYLARSLPRSLKTWWTKSKQCGSP